MAGQTKTTRGGSRPGAGRPPRVTVQKMVRLTPEEVDHVQKCAKLAGLSVHAWMVAAVRSALETPQAVVNPIKKPAGCP